jgi:hypothetical protein
MTCALSTTAHTFAGESQSPAYARNVKPGYFATLVRMDRRPRHHIEHIYWAQNTSVAHVACWSALQYERNKGGAGGGDGVPSFVHPQFLETKPHGTTKPQRRDHEACEVRDGANEARPLTTTKCGASRQLRTTLAKGMVARIHIAADTSFGSSIALLPPLQSPPLVRGGLLLSGFKTEDVGINKPCFRASGNYN